MQGKDIQKLTLETSGGIQVWKQEKHDGPITLATIGKNGVENETLIKPGDMVMLGNLYRKNRGHDISEALKKQRPLKPIGKTDEFGDIHIVCPNCEISGLAIPFVRSPQGFKYCPECGQAIDWEVAE